MAQAFRGKKIKEEVINKLEIIIVSLQKPAIIYAGFSFL